MLGKEPSRFGMATAYSPANYPGIPVDEVLLSERFQTGGYATGIFGKWHLGLHSDQAPWVQGFDVARVLLHGFMKYYGVQDNSLGLTPYADGTYGHSHHGGHDLLANGVPIHSSQYSTFLFRDAAKEWIGKQAKAGNDFYAYIPFNAPHGPYGAPRSYVDLYVDHFGITSTEIALLGVYIDDVLAIPSNFSGDSMQKERLQELLHYAAVRAMDDAIADLYEKLVELGIENETLFLVNSDNGPSTSPEIGGRGEMRGGKGSPNEGGHRVENFIIWPEEIAPGEVIDSNIWIADLYPTFLSISGIPIPTDLDGVDVSDALRGQPFDRGVIYPHVRVRGTQVEFSALHGDWKYIRRTFISRDENGNVSTVNLIVEGLYDLSIDIEERNNLDANPLYAAKLAEMRANYDSFGGDTYLLNIPFTVPETPFFAPLEWGASDITDYADPRIIKYDHGLRSIIWGEEDADIIWANAGNDTVFARGGDDIIRGGPGRDFLYGGDGNDTINAGPNSLKRFQYLAGQLGDDTYEYASGDGSIFISRYAEQVDGGNDRLLFIDLNLSDVTPRRHLNNVLRIDTPSGQIRVHDLGTRIEAYEFADGQILTAAELLP